MNPRKVASQLQEDKYLQSMEEKKLSDDIAGKPMDLAQSIAIDILLFVVFGGLAYAFTQDLFKTWIIPVLIALVIGALVAGIREFFQMKKREKYYSILFTEHN